MESVTGVDVHAHRAYTRSASLPCRCEEFGRDHVAPLEEYDADELVPEHRARF